MPLREDELKGLHSEQVQELNSQLRQKETILEDYKRSHGKLEVFFNRVMQCITPITPFDSVYEKMKIHRKSESPVNAVSHITDLHMGSCQEADEIEGFNEFSPEIATDRMLNFAQRYAGWIDTQRYGYNIKELDVIMTGDLISGDIHDELRITNAYPSPEQVVQAAQLLAKVIALKAPHFEKVVIHFLTEDNHSRLTKKPQAKEAGKNSMNYLVGRMLELYISKIQNVEFHLYAMHEKVITVLNRNYLIKHGHGIKAWMGIPWYSIERSVAKESTARMNLIMEDLQRAKDIGFHKMIFGHFHTPFDYLLYSCGGSVSGTDSYDHQAGRYSPPTQSGWLVHPKYAEFNRMNFDLRF